VGHERRDHRQQRVTRNHSDALDWVRRRGRAGRRPRARSDPRGGRRIITDIYEPINNRVYRAGFATKQGPYDEAVDELFDALDHWDSVLEDQRFLAGDQLTEADICMFTTLIRFDHVYHTHFMCNVQYIHQYQYLTKHPRLAVSAA